MEPKMEQPKQYTPEEIAELEKFEKSRTISDAELLKGGAKYVVNEKGEKENLLITKGQVRVEDQVEIEKIEKWKKLVDKYNEASSKEGVYTPNFSIKLENGEKIKAVYSRGDDRVEFKENKIIISVPLFDAGNGNRNWMRNRRREFYLSEIEDVTLQMKG